MLVYILTSFALLAFALYLQVTAALINDTSGTFTWYITLDCGFVAVYMAVLLLSLVLCHLPCCNHR